MPTIVYRTAGGSEIARQSFTSGAPFRLRSTKVSQTGKDHVGWDLRYYDGYQDVIVEKNLGEGVTIRTDYNINAYARMIDLERIEYYDSYQTKVLMKTFYKAIGTSYNTSEAGKFYRTGYDHYGWRIQGPNSYWVYDRLNVPMTVSKGGQDWYAEWNPITYKITYDVKGASGSHSNRSTYTISSDTFFLSKGSLSKSNHEFVGWRLNGAGPLVDRIPEGSYGDKHFVAVWLWSGVAQIDEDNDNGVIMELSAWEYIPSATKRQEIAMDVQLLEGYKWDDIYAVLSNSNREGNIGTEKPYVSNREGILVIPPLRNDDITIVNKTSMYTYTVTYHLEGGSGTHGNPTTYNVETPTITLKQGALTKRGYSFVGWGLTPDDGPLEQFIPTGSTGPKVFYAVWIEDSYSVSYNLGGSTTYPVTGGNSGNPKWYTVTSDDIAFLTAGYVRGGFTPNAWSPSGIPTGSIGNVTTVLSWSALEQRVNTDYQAINYRTSDTDGKSHNIILDTPTKVGYIFKGWKETSNNLNKGAITISGNTVTIPQGSYGDIDIISMWDPIQYSIRFNLNTGSGNVPDKTGIKYDANIGTLPSTGFSKTGYIFQGWFLTSDGRDQITSSSRNLTTVNGATINAYAIWEAITYTVKVENVTNPLISWTPPAPRTVRYDQEIGNFVLNKIPGYKFKNILKYSDGKVFAGTDKNKTTVNGSTVSLYIDPIPNILTIVYEKGGDSIHPVTGTMTNSEGSYDGQIGIKNNGYQRIGYSFNGWMSNDGGPSGNFKYLSAGQTYNINDISKEIGNSLEENKTIYLTAQWVRNDYTLSFVTNIPSITIPSKVYSYDTPTDALDELVYAGFIFEGWYYEPSFIKKAVSRFNMPSNDVILYGKWTGIKYNIIIDENGGKPIPNLSYISSLGDQSLTLTNNGRVELGMYYTFNKWTIGQDTIRNSSSVGASSLNIPKEAYGDMNVKANWNTAIRKVMVGNVQMTEDSIRAGNDVISKIIITDDDSNEIILFENEEREE